MARQVTCQLKIQEFFTKNWYIGYVPRIFGSRKSRIFGAAPDKRRKLGRDLSWHHKCWKNNGEMWHHQKAKCKLDERRRAYSMSRLFDALRGARISVRLKTAMPAKAYGKRWESTEPMDRRP